MQVLGGGGGVLDQLDDAEGDLREGGDVRDLADRVLDDLQTLFFRDSHPALLVLLDRQGTSAIGGRDFGANDGAMLTRAGSVV